MNESLSKHCYLEGMPAFAEQLRERYLRHLLDDIVPFWERHSMDWEQGGQFNCLARDGRVFDTRKYVWMQGRSVWTFCRLYNEVERREQWLGSAEHILRFVRAHAVDDEGRCYFSLNRVGEPVFQQRKPYAAFFLALALLEYAKTGAGEGDALRAEARVWYGRIREWIADGRLLGRPALAGARPVRQAADVMVVASLALEFGEQETLRACVAQAREHWIPERRMMLENLPLDGADYRESSETRLLCPGSALEVAWFLWHALEALGTDAGKDWLCDVIEASLESGWDRDHGGLYYFQDSEGFPSLQLEANMKLWWPHTEAIYALVLAWRHTGDARLLEWLQRVDEYAFRTFADGESGEWFGYCDRYGKPALELKGGPYKCFFHVPRFLMFSARRLGGV